MRNALDAVMADWHDNRDNGVPSSFRFASDAQNRSALAALAPTYDGFIDRWIASIPTVPNAPPCSR